MGVSNPEMFLPEKDLSKSSVEFSFLVRHPLEFQEDQCKIVPFQDKGERTAQQQKQEEYKHKLKVDDEEENDGFKTPTSLDQKIPAMLKCPPAPTKPKTQKRKAFRTTILLDFTKEIDCLFPPALLADLGNKIKKVRQGSDFK